MPVAGSLAALAGGALAGTLLLDPPVPGIAVNAERLDPAQPADAPAYRAQPSRITPPDERDSDDHWLALGYVTVTPVSGAIGAAEAPRRELEQRLRKL
jgi:hypothetical protein